MGRDWGGSRYSRVYYTVKTDPKFVTVYADTLTFGWWVKLLMEADGAYPEPAVLPRSLPKAVLAKLVEAGLVVLGRGDFYTISGLDIERQERDERYSNGGKARAASADRGADGRFSTLNSSSDAGERWTSDSSSDIQRVKQSRVEKSKEPSRGRARGDLREEATRVNVGLLRSRHNAGEHDGRVRGCPSCTNYVQ